VRDKKPHNRKHLWKGKVNCFKRGLFRIS